MKIPAYPKYKKSGVEWLGDDSIDEHKEYTSSSIVFPKRGAAIFTNKATIVTKIF
jgi:hypothetical protein